MFSFFLLLIPHFVLSSISVVSVATNLTNWANFVAAEGGSRTSSVCYFNSFLKISFKKSKMYIGLLKKIFVT